MRKLNHHLRSETLSSVSTATLMKEQQQQPMDNASASRFEEKATRHREYGKFRQAFVHVLDDPEL
ncbi:hypothetical protein GGI12_006086, partial [Dipsacomyces acuminosporus]